MKHFYVIVMVVVFIAACTKQSAVYDAGYMYWYGPTLLEAAPWHMVLTGTVASVAAPKQQWNGTFSGGELDVENVIFRSPTKDMQSFAAKRLKSDGGFTGLSKGDKVLVFLIKYEGGYALPDYQGTSCRLGAKLESFDDPIIDAVKRMAKNRVIDKKDESAWEKYDAKGLAHRLEMQQFMQMQQD